MQVQITSAYNSFVMMSYAARHRQEQDKNRKMLQARIQFQLLLGSENDLRPSQTRHHSLNG